MSLRIRRGRHRRRPTLGTRPLKVQIRFPGKHQVVPFNWLGIKERHSWLSFVNRWILVLADSVEYGSPGRIPSNCLGNVLRLDPAISADSTGPAHVQADAFGIGETGRR